MPYATIEPINTTFCLAEMTAGSVESVYEVSVIGTTYFPDVIVPI